MYLPVTGRMEQRQIVQRVCASQGTRHNVMTVPVCSLSEGLCTHRALSLLG